MPAGTGVLSTRRVDVIAGNEMPASRATPQHALEIAERWPDARDWAVELRPLMG
jgi:hypothetical protein